MLKTTLWYLYIHFIYCFFVVIMMVSTVANADPVVASNNQLVLPAPILLPKPPDYFTRMHTYRVPPAAISRNNRVLPLPVGIGKTALPYNQVLLVPVINGQKQAFIVRVLQDDRGHLWMNRQDLKTLHVVVPNIQPFVYKGGDYYRLELLNIGYQVNKPLEELDLQINPELLQSTQLSLDNEQFLTPQKSPWGGFFNYDLSAQKLSHQSANNGGIFEAGLFNHYGVLTDDFLVQNVNNSTKSLRLDTTWTMDQPDVMRSLHVGDEMSTPGLWGKAVGFGGIQYGTNFATQPNFISFPLPAVRGEAVYPSVADVYINNSLVAQSNLTSGPFVINNIPAITGQGNVNLVVTDLLGRQTLVNVPYYSSNELLRKGLHDFSFESGWIRNNFGIDSNDYGRFILSGTDSYGINDHLTGQLHAELLKANQSAGLGANILVGDYGILSLAGAGSYNKDHHQGGLALLGFERQTLRYSYGFSTQITSHSFSEAGIPDNQLSPSSLTQAFIAVPIGQGTVGCNYIDQVSRGQPNVDLVGLSYSRNLFKTFYFSATGNASVSGQKVRSLFLTLTKLLAKQTTLSVGSINQQQDLPGGGDTTNQAIGQLSRSLPVGDGYGYDLIAAGGNNSFAQGDVSLQNSVGTYTAGIGQQQNQTDYQFGAAGGLALMDNDFYLTRQINSSFAVVEVPDSSDVTVSLFNQPIAKTDRQGKALVPNLSPYQINNLSIEQQDLPLDATIDSLQENAIPYYRSGVLVKFPVKRSRSATFKLRLPNGQPIPTGANINIVGQTQLFPVGANGTAYVSGLQKRTAIEAQWDNQHCRALVIYPSHTHDPMPDLGTLTCH